MSSSSSAQKVLRFGAFEVDLQAGLLRKHGIRVRIQQQPLKVLAALLERPGEVVAGGATPNAVARRYLRRF